jgi:hypothetical protein
MDPTEGETADSAVARPVPRAWLDPHVVDAKRLDRLLADRELVDQLRAAGYTGPDWDYVAGVLIKYGYAVLISWMRQGVIWRRLADKGRGGLPTPPHWEWNDDTWNELAGTTLVVALQKFRDNVLVPGRWNPDRGASLKTFFIGQCLFCFPNPYRSWHTAVTARQCEAPDDLSGWSQHTPSTRGPEEDLIIREAISDGLAGLDERTGEILVLLDQGYDQTEVADRIGTTRKAVEMIVRRHRSRAGNPTSSTLHRTRGRGQHGAAS